MPQICICVRNSFPGSASFRYHEDLVYNITKTLTYFKDFVDGALNCTQYHIWYGIHCNLFTPKMEHGRYWDYNYLYCTLFFPGLFLNFFLIFAHLWCGVLGFSVDGILGHPGGWGDFGFLGIGALYINLEE